MNERLNQNAGSSGVLAIKHLFGLNCDGPQTVDLFDDKSVCYSAGSYLVRYNMEDKSQSYALNNKLYTNITAVCVSPKGTYLAVGRRGLKNQIQLFDKQFLRPSKATMALSEDDFRQMPDFYHLAFSENEDRILALSNQKDPVVSFWAIETGQTNIKLLAKFSMKSYECIEACISLQKNDIISVIGRGNFKMLKFYDDSLRLECSGLMIRKDTPTDYNCHTWLSTTGFYGMIVCTGSRYIYVLRDNADILFTIDNNSENVKSMPQIIDIFCIASIEDGFIVGGDSMRIQQFKKQSSGMFLPNEAVRVSLNNTGGLPISDTRSSCITALRIDNKDDRMVLLTEARVLYTTQLKSNDILRMRESVDLNGASGTQPKFSLVFEPSHSEKINFIDSCVRKPLFVTCSSDKTVKVWDYETREQHSNMTFSEEALAVAFHPSGFHLALAFADKIQVVNLYLKPKDMQRSLPEFAVKSCRFMKFNHGGDLLAAASGDSPPEIFIFRFYDYSTNPVHRLKGHSGLIRSLEWSPDDLSLFSCGAQGMIYKWSMRDGERKEINQKRIGSVNDMCLSYENQLSSTQYSYSILLAVEEGDSGSLRELTSNGAHGRCDGGPSFGSVVKSSEKKMIFAGVRDSNRDGAIFFYRHPLSGKETDTTFAHSHLGVSKMVLTYKDKFLITAGNDGVLGLFEVDDKDSKGGPSTPSEFKDYCPHVLVSPAEINDLNSQKNDAMSQLANETSQNPGSIEMAGGPANDSIRSQTEFKKIKSDNAEKVESLLKELEAKEQERKKQYEAEIAAYKNKVKDMEVYATLNLGEKQVRIKDLEKRMATSDNMFRARMEEEDRRHQSQLQDLENKFQEDLQREQEEMNRIRNNIEAMIKQHENELTTLQQVAGSEYKELADEYDEKQAELRKNLIKLKNDQQSNEKKFLKNVNRENQLKDSLKEAKTTLEKVSEQKTHLEKSIKVLEGNLKAKNMQITESERRIYEQKKRTGELEKFKYVLDFKIKELKKDMLPRDKEIAQLKGETTRIDKELKELNDLSNYFTNIVRTLQEEQKSLQKTVDNQTKDLIKQNNKIKKRKNQLYECIHDAKRYTDLVEKLKEMNENPKPLQEIDEDIYQECASQIRFLELADKQIKMRLLKDSKVHGVFNERIMRQNIKLLKKQKLLKEEVDKIKGDKNKHFAKIGKLRKDQEEDENRIAELCGLRERLLDQIEKLDQDLEQLKVSKPQAAEKLEAARAALRQQLDNYRQDEDGDEDYEEDDDPDDPDVPEDQAGQGME